jgi:protein ERP2
MLKIIVRSLILFAVLFNGCSALQTELSIIVDAGHRECFFQQLLRGMSIETDYQVLSGGDLDVSYWISSPSNRVVFTELRKQGGQAHFRTEETGEYRFCFDNSFSRFAYKLVFFYFTTNDQFVDPHFPAASANDNQQQLYEMVKDELGELEEKLETFKDTFRAVVNNLEKAQRIQNLFKAYEMADRNLMEHNFERVNFWSFVNVFLMICVGVIQVVMIRSLFEDKSKIGRVLRGGSSPGEKRSMT